jgi:hypothetical protein
MLATVIIALAAAAAPLAAQDTVGPTDTAPPPPLPLMSPPVEPPLPPTPEQVRYLEGLRSVGRGVAQLRDAIDRVARTQQAGDSVQRRRAARRLGGLCTTARSFISTGRPRMQPTAYTDSMQIVARQLVMRIDSVFKFLPTCETTAGKTPVPISADLQKRLQAYDTALLAFRAGLAAMNRVDSVRTPSQP